MNFYTAHQALEGGVIGIRLPEWTGYWFLKDNEIHVLTKNGEINDTPYMDLYKHRKDWELVQQKGLGFDFAILALKNGKLVSREGWNGKGMFVFMRPGDSLQIDMIVNRVKSLPQSFKDHVDKVMDDNTNRGEKGLGVVEFLPYFCMKAADGSIVNGWLASQTDMLATDWGLAE